MRRRGQRNIEYRNNAQTREHKGSAEQMVLGSNVLALVIFVYQLTLFLLRSFFSFFFFPFFTVSYFDP
jgi:hypothetical protein